MAKDETQHSAAAEHGWIFVGISGVTNGGKTLLKNYLMKRFEGSLSISQDTFFRSKYDEKHEIIQELNHANWEALSSVDWDRLIETIKDTTSQHRPTKTSLFIVEGHIIFNHPELVKMFRKKYFFTLTKEECINRRQYRVYDPPDPPGYFEIVVWPMYLKNKEEMEKNVKDIVYLDGTGVAEEIQKSVEGDLLRLMSELNADTQ